MTKHPVSDSIKFDSTLPVSAVSENPLSFLALDKLLHSFRIVTDHRKQWLEDLQLDADLTFIFKGKEQTPRTAEKLLRTNAFREYVKEKAKPERKYLLYRPLAPPYKVNPLYFVMNSPTIAHAYENKRYFRDEFASLIAMPDFDIRMIDELDKETYEMFKEAFGNFVIQEEESSGSRGTFIVKNYEQFLEVALALKKHATTRSVVISRMIDGHSAGVQGCITKGGSFTSGIQRMVIGSDVLTNTNVDTAPGFAGGVVGSDYSQEVHKQAAEIVNVISAKLAKNGYKGIFGVDLIITPDDEVYAIEINARMTAFTHIVADMQLNADQIPFLLLHLLEVGNYDYEITNLAAIPNHITGQGAVSYLIQNNKNVGNFTMPSYIKPGVYSLKDGKLEHLRHGYSINDLKKKNEFLLFSSLVEGNVVSEGERLYTVTFKGNGMEKDDDDINQSSKDIFAAINEHYGIEFDEDEYSSSSGNDYEDEDVVIS